MSGQTLYLCEKPSQAKDIARVMGLSQRGQGYISGPGTTVTWAIGHLLENTPPDAYGEQYGSPWKAESLPVLPPCWKMVVKKDTADQFAVINRLLKQVDAVVIATDADREGEVIARELLEHCQFSGGVKRLWLSALDEASVRRALDNLLPGDETALLYQAGLGRSQADWLVGMNMTRLYTVKARELGFGDVLSVGRVQTPTLALVVRRDNEIANFVPTPFWQVLAQLEKDGVRFRAAWVPAASYCDDEKRCVQQAVAQAVEQLCRQTGSAIVTGVVTKRDKTPAPLGFDLGTLQEVCSRKWGMGANQVLGIAQARMTLAAFMQKQVQWTSHLVERGRTQTISLTPPVTPPCPVCGGITRKRQGKQGVFYSCTRYPECKGMANVPGSKPRGKGKGRKNAPAS
jgi:DNA topoisomerase-3